MSARVNTDQDYSGVVEAAIEVSRRRRDALLVLKAARVANNVKEAFRIIDELVPDSVLDSHEKMPATVARIDRRPSRSR